MTTALTRNTHEPGLTLPNFSHLSETLKVDVLSLQLEERGQQFRALTSYFTTKRSHPSSISPGAEETQVIKPQVKVLCEMQTPLPK